MHISRFDLVSKLGVAVSVALIAAACNGSGVTDTTQTVDTTVVDGTTTSPPSTTSESTTPGSTSPTSQTDTTSDTTVVSDSTEPSEPGLTGHDSCLTGTWQMDNTVFETTLANLYGQSGAEATVSVDGQSIVEFRPDGGFTGGYDDFVAAVTATGLPELEISFEGAGDGRWATDDGLIQLQPESLEINTQASVGGQPMGDLGPQIGQLGAFEIAPASYTCDDQTLTIDQGDGVVYQAQRLD